MKLDANWGNHFLKWVKREILHALPAIIFFAISFNLIVFSEDLMFKKHYFSASYFLSATIGAILIGKILLIIDSFSFLNAFPKKPLIYNIVWKFLIYTFAVLLFRIFDNFFHAASHFKNMDLAYQYTSMALSSSIFWAIQTWITMLFLIYVTANEFIERLGRKKILKLLLG